MTNPASTDRDREATSAAARDVIAYCLNANASPTPDDMAYSAADEIIADLEHHGWCVVPIEPTEAMVEAAYNSDI